MNSVYPKNIFLAVVFVASLRCAGGAWDIASAQPEPAAPAAAPGATTATTTNPGQALEAVLAGGKTPPFVYIRERPDPFFPFLTQEIMKAEAKANAELMGPRKFEPAQLILVAIVSGKRGFIAMAQDSAGIGYVLRKGTKVGEAGVVTQITQNKVIIEQVKNVTGQRTSRKVEMILNKEGEK